MINFPGCIVDQKRCIVDPGVDNIFQIQRFDKSDTDISDLIIECFDRDESCQK